MERKIQSIKGSLYVNIPEGVVEFFGLKPGDKVDVRIDGEKISISTTPSKERVRK